MTYVRSFQGFAPPPRYDKPADPFVFVKIEESSDADGSRTLIDTIPLAPPDADPEHPKPRNFTTDKATLDPAYYTLVWEDAGGQTFRGEPIYFPEEVDWSPSVADVAAHIRARTKDAGGNEVGTFDETTRPTGEEVERLIVKAVRRVQTQVQTPCTTELQEDAGAAAAIYAAMLIEQSYFPEQTQAAGSSFNSLNTLWKEQIKVLDQEVARICGGAAEAEGGGTGAEAGLTPVLLGNDDREIIGPSSKPL